MKRFTQRALPTLIVSTLLTCLSTQAVAQRVPIVDAQGAQTNPQNNPRVQSAQSNQRAQSGSFEGNTGGDLIYQLYSRLDQLQQEMQTLRGTVEEQSYRIQRMEQEQRDRYLDLDQRVSELGTPGAGGPAAVSRQGAGGSNLYPPGMVPLNEDIADEVAAQSRTPGTGPATGTADPAALPSTAENEQQIYRSALNILLEDGNHEASIRGFQQYIDNYPQGRYFTNALYWQGEAFILAGRYAEAESVFSRVVDDYPDDPKAAGALLKIGVSYQQTGQVDQAREAWQSLRNRYPDSLTEIRAAEDYLKRLPSP